MPGVSYRRKSIAGRRKSSFLGYAGIRMHSRASRDERTPIFGLLLSVLAAKWDANYWRNAFESQTTRCSRNNAWISIMEIAGACDGPTGDPGVLQREHSERFSLGCVVAVGEMARGPQLSVAGACQRLGNVDENARAMMSYVVGR